MSNPAETYEREMVPALFAPWVPVLFQAVSPQPSERVLDVACGTGIVARQVANLVGPGGQVVGFDLNPAMLEVARARAAEEGLAIEWRQGQAETLPFPDDGFDLVLCQQGLQFFTDRPHGLAEMHRVLRPGGRVGLSVWLGLDHHPFFAVMNEVVVRQLGFPALAAPFSLGSADELHTLLSGAGFREIVIEPHSRIARFPHPDRFVAMMVDVIVAAIPSAQGLDQPAREALTRALIQELGGSIPDMIHEHHLAIPSHSHVARAIR